MPDETNDSPLFPADQNSPHRKEHDLAAQLDAPESREMRRRPSLSDKISYLGQIPYQILEISTLRSENLVDLLQTLWISLRILNRLQSRQ
jgi:hypothetical protein